MTTNLHAVAVVRHQQRLLAERGILLEQLLAENLQLRALLLEAQALLDQQYFPVAGGVSDRISTALEVPHDKPARG